MKKSTLDFWLIIAVVVSFGTAAGFIAGCEKTKAAPRPVQAVALAAGCADTAGIYVPVLSGGFNNGIIQGGHAHFIRVCNEVYVSGVLGSNLPTKDTLSPAAIIISLPIPSNLMVSPSDVRGQLTLTQSGVRQPLNGFVNSTGISGILLNWRPTALSNIVVSYSFTYTIK